MTEDLDLELELDRQESVFLLIKTFINSSVIRRGEVIACLAMLEKLLEVCVRDNQYLEALSLWYLRASPSEESDEKQLTKEGEVRFRINWEKHSLEIKAGKDKVLMSEADIMGSISPMFNRLADEIRSRCLRDKINDLHWRITFSDLVDETSGLRVQLRKELSLAGSHSKQMNDVDKDFRNSDREEVTARAQDLSELGLTSIWRKHQVQK